MEFKPTLFIGSSKEGLPVHKQFASHLALSSSASPDLPLDLDRSHFTPKLSHGRLFRLKEIF